MRGFATEVKTQLKGMGDFTVNVGVNVDNKEAQAKLDETAKDKKVNVEVDVDDKKAAAALDDTTVKADKLDGRQVTLDVVANVAKALTGLAAVATAADALDKRTLSPKINIDFKGVVGDLASLVGRLASAGVAVGSFAEKTALVSVAAAGAVKAVGSLGPVVQGAVGAAALLPAVLLSGAAAAGTMVIGLHGVGAAVTAAFDPTKAKELGADMAKLSPNAQAFVTQLASMKGGFTALQLDVQNKLFLGMGQAVKDLGAAYLPMAQAGFGKMATEINDSVVAFAQFLSQGDQVALMQRTTDNVTTGFHNLVFGGLDPALQAITTIAAVGSSELPGIGTAIASVSSSFNGFIQQVAASGALKAFLDGAVNQLGYLFQALGFLGQIFGKVFQAGAAAGGNLLLTITNITGSIAAFLYTAQGMQMLTTIFTMANTAMANAQPLLNAIGQMLVALLPTLASVLPAMGSALGALAPAMAPLGAIIAALAPVLAVVANIVSQVLVVALNALAPIIQALAPLFIQWAISIGSSLISAINTLAPLLTWLAQTLAAHPKLVFGVITALTTLVAAWRIFSTVIGALLSPLLVVRLVLMATGLSLTALLKPLWDGVVAIGGFIGKFTEGLSVWGIAQKALSLLGSGLLSIGKAILTGMGPLGWLVTIFTILYSSNEQFRGAINGLIGSLLQIVGSIFSSLMPAFNAVMGIFNSLSGVAGGLISTFAGMLVPVINGIAAAVNWLSPAIVVLVDGFIAWKVATMAWSAAQAIATVAMNVWKGATAAAAIVGQIYTGIQEEGAAAFVTSRIAMAASTIATYAMAAAQWVLNAAMDANPIMIVVLILAALVAAVVLAYTHFQWFRDLVNGVWSAIVAGAQAVWSGIVTAFNAVMAFLQRWGVVILAVLMPFIGLPILIYQNWGAITGFFGRVFSAIGNFFTSLPGMALSALQAVGRFFLALPGNLVAAVGFMLGVVVRFFLFDLPTYIAQAGKWIASTATTMWNGLITGLTTMAVNIGLWFYALPGRIGAWVTGAASAVASTAVSMWHGLVDGLTTAAINIGLWFSTLPARMHAWLAAVGAAIVADAAAVWSYLTTGLPAQLAALGAWFLSLPAKIGGWIAGAGTWLSGAGGDIVSGLWNGIVAGWDAFIGWIGGLVTRFIQGFEAGLGIASPSTVFAQIGVNILLGLLNGLETAWTTIVGWFTTAAAYLAGAFTNAWLNIENIAIAVWNAISGFFAGALAGFVAFWTGIWTAITTYFTYSWAMLQYYATVAWMYIQMIFYTGLNNFIAFWTGIWNAILSFFAYVWSEIQLEATIIWFQIEGFFLGALNNFLAFWTGIWNTVSSFFAYVWGQIVYQGTVLWLEIEGFFLTALTNFIAFWTGIWNAVSGFFAYAWGQIVYQGTVLWLEIQGFFYNAIAAFSAWFNSIWNAIVGFFVNDWNNIRDNAVAIWNTISGFFSSAFASFQAYFTGVWNNIAGAFSAIWQGISDEAGRIWNGMIAVIKGAVNGVIDAANFMINGVDAVLKVLLIPVIPDIPRLAAGGVITMARGGVLPGYAPGRDTVPAVLSKGEGVLVPEAVRGLGGAGFVGWANRHFSGGRSSGGANTPQGGRGYSRGGVSRFDIGGIVGGVGNWIGSAANHVGDFASGTWKKLTDALADAANWIGDPLNALKSGMKGALDSLMPTGIFHDAGNFLVDKVFAAVSSKVTAAEAASSGAAMGPVSASHALDIVNAAKSKGIPHAGAVIAIMTGMQESGLRVLANPAVPASMALPHDGVGNDHDSVGIFQQRQSWGPTALLMNPFGSAQLFYNKLGRGPYGDYGAEAQRVQVSAFPGAYSKWRGQAEGLVTGSGFDAGGIASGSGFLAKQIVAPERVLSPRQTTAFESMVPMLASMNRGGSVYSASDYASSSAGGGPRVVQYIYPSQSMDEVSLANAARRREEFAGRFG